MVRLEQKLTIKNKSKCNRIKSHSDKQAADGTIGCKGCGKNFKGKTSLRKRPGGKIYYKFEPEPDYKDHILSKCQEYKELNLIVKCKFCDKSFSNQNGLKTNTVTFFTQLIIVQR